MKDSECIDFLRWALPQLRMRWPGFRKVRRQVCKRIERRRRELGLPSVSTYRSYLETHREEWPVLDSLCRISISRFHRDRDIFDHIRQEILPALAEMALARGGKEILCWSIGCASGEEVYTLKIIWNLCLLSRFPDLTFRIIATDADERLLERAQRGCYTTSSLRNLPSEWVEMAFIRSGEKYRIREGFKGEVNFLLQDVRTELPDSSFHIIFCRNLVFTYFEEELQREVLTQIAQKLILDGALVIGKKERLPTGVAGLAPWVPNLKIYRKIAQHQ
ncbi:MAG: CheR family methyltransferase [bacterium]